MYLCRSIFQLEAHMVCVTWVHHMKWNLYSNINSNNWWLTGECPLWYWEVWGLTPSEVTANMKPIFSTVSPSQLSMLWVCSFKTRWNLSDRCGKKWSREPVLYNHQHPSILSEWPSSPAFYLPASCSWLNRQTSKMSPPEKSEYRSQCCTYSLAGIMFSDVFIWSRFLKQNTDCFPFAWGANTTDLSFTPSCY